MRFFIEVIADDRDDAVNLLREAATHIKKKREEHGKTVNHCIGDYRVRVYDEDEATPFTSDARPGKP